MISIVGKNGAGKSTMAKLLCGFEKLEKGKICIFFYKKTTVSSVSFVLLLTEDLEFFLIS